MLWNKEEHDFLLECFAESISVKDAVHKFRKVHPSKSYDGIKRYLDRHYQKPMSYFLGATKQLLPDPVFKGPNPEIKIEAPPTFEEKSIISKLRKEIESLRSDLHQAFERAHTSEKLRNLIHEINGAEFNKIPKWTTAKRVAHTNGIPSLFLSDLHYDETVIPEQINNLNEYNHTIAEKRIEYCFTKSVDITKNQFVNPNYDGFHLILNGDIFSGNIHEELRETNHQPILKSVVDLEERLKRGIELLLEHYPKVLVTCACGNHSRLDKKPRAKNRVFDNYEWILYQHLAKFFRDEPRVTFLIPDSYEFTFEIYKKRILQTHGDIFKGGGGIGGILVPIYRGMAKRQENYAAVGKAFDTMIIGHFHQLIQTERLIVNGSVKGFDEWVMQMGFPFEVPRQSLHLNHPEHGIVMFTKILCDEYKNE